MHKQKISNSKLLFFIFSFIFCFLNLKLPCYAKDKIIAVVNKDIITKKDLGDFINFMRIQLSKEYSGEELEKKINSMKVDLLDRLIEDKLILQQAKKDDIRIDDNRVKARINEIRSHYASNSEFENDLMKQGLSLGDIENKIREQMLMYIVIDSKIRSKLTVRPEEVTNLYQNNLKDFVSGEERELQIVALENEDLANSFSYNYKRGDKLEDLAARYPLTVDKLKATENGELRKDIEDAVFALNYTEVSKPIKIDNKYYVFKLENIIPSRQFSLTEVQDKIYNHLSETKMQEELTKWLDELKKQSYIKISQD